MLVSRDAMRAFGLILLLALSMVGCQSAPEQIASKVETDDFGGVLPMKEEISVESVQKAEMMHRRAQAEFRLGPSCPFDLADPGRDPHTKIGIAGGGKLQLETAKNIYMALSVDWTDNVVEANTGGIGEQIFAVRGYDRLSILGTLDYDIPLTEDPGQRAGLRSGPLDGLLLRIEVVLARTILCLHRALQRPAPLDILSLDGCLYVSMYVCVCMYVFLSMVCLLFVVCLFVVCLLFVCLFVCYIYIYTQ